MAGPFRYDPYVNPLAGSIGSLMARQGDAASRAAELTMQATARADAQKAAAWSGAIGTIGSNLAEMLDPAKRQAQQLRARQIDMEGQRLQMQHEEMRDKQTDRQRSRDAEAAVSKALASTALNDDGTYNVPALAKAIDPAFGQAAIPLFQHLESVNTSIKQQDAKDRQEAQQAAAQIIAAGSHPLLADSWIVTARRKGLIRSDEEMAQYRQALADDPSQGEAILRSFINPQKPIEMERGKTYADPLTMRPVFTVPDPQGDADVALKQAQTKKTTGEIEGTLPPTQAQQLTASQQAETARHNREQERLAAIAASRAAKPDTDLVQVMGPNGVPIWTPKSQAAGQPAAQAPRAVTGAERTALAFYNRAKDAVETLTTARSGGDSLEQRMAKQSLAGQARLQYAHNALQTQDQQAYRQAQRAFTEARLRKESGAAIPDAEYENDAKTYFVQPGDGPAQVEQKRQARQTVLEGLKFGSGKAFDEYYGEPNVSPPRGGQKPQATQSAAAPALGSVVTVRGQKVRVTKVGPDGQFEGVPVP